MAETTSLFEISSDSLRSSALKICAWPNEIGPLRDLAKIFIRRFANADPDDAGAKYIGEYCTVLAIMRGRHTSIEAGWNAFEQALQAAGKPLFGALAKTAIAYLPGRTAATGNGSGYQDLSGDDA